MNVVEVTGETVSKLSRLVKKAGEQQRAIVLELSKELGHHNDLIQRALDKQARLANKVQRIEEHVMSKEIYNYEQIRQKLQAQKVEERKRESQRKAADQKKLREAEQERRTQTLLKGQAQAAQSLPQSKPATQIEEEVKAAASPAAAVGPNERTGDPFKDFQLDLKTFEHDETALRYVKIGREATYKFIDMLYCTDWQFEKKTADGIKMYSMRTGGSEPGYVRFETKFGQVTVAELADYFSDIDKRMAWQKNCYESLEQVRLYPLKTSMYYGKLLGKPEKDSLLITHKVEIKGNRQYLVSVSAEHSWYPPQAKVQRTSGVTHANYFEPTADGKGVKHILIAQLEKTSSGELVRSFGKEGTNQTHLTSLSNLKELLIGTRQTSAPTSYLARASEEGEAAKPLADAAENQGEDTIDSLTKEGEGAAATEDAV